MLCIIVHISVHLQKNRELFNEMLHAHRIEFREPALAALHLAPF